MKSRTLFLILILIVAGNVNRSGALPLSGAGVERRAERRETLALGGRSEADERRELEERILAATVRIELLGWRGTGDERAPVTVANRAHATIKDGRYLVTHNHFEPSLAWSTGRYSAVSLYKANGEILLNQAPMTAFRVVTGDAEALVLEFLNETGDGLFESLALPSADFAAGERLGLRPGMEVAQVNWNGRTTEVQWVGINRVIDDGATPYLEMASLIEQGSSGGGVFWQGIHVANNWFRVVTRDTDRRQILDSYSTAALNTPGVTDFDGQVEMFRWSASNLVRWSP